MANLLSLLGDRSRRTQGSSKFDKLLEILRGNNEKKVVFTKYRRTLEFLSRQLTGCGIAHAVFHGGLSASQKDAQIMEFADAKPVLVSTESGGEGRNLQFCNTMVNFDLPWNPMRIEQRIGRIHRIGQQREVFVFNLCATGSVEDHLLTVLDKKINMFELVVGEVDMILGNLGDGRDFPELILEIWARSAGAREAELAFQALGEQLAAAKRDYVQIRDLDRELFSEDYEA